MPNPEIVRVSTALSPGTVNDRMFSASRLITTPDALLGAATTLLGSPPAASTSPVLVKVPAPSMVNRRTLADVDEVTSTEPLLATSTELQSPDPVKRVPICVREATSITDTGWAAPPSQATTCFPLGLKDVSSPTFEIGIGLGAPVRLGGERLIAHTWLRKSVTKAWVWSCVTVQSPIEEGRNGSVTDCIRVRIKDNDLFSAIVHNYTASLGR